MKRVLVVLHRLELLLNLGSIFLEICKFFLLLSFQVANETHLPLVPFFKDLVEGQLFVLSHFVLEVDGLRPILVCRQVATLVFDGQACSVVFLACLCEITLRQSLPVLEIPFFRFENVHLLLEDFYLGGTSRSQ